MSLPEDVAVHVSSDVVTDASRSRVAQSAG